MDVNHNAVLQTLAKNKISHIVHGHTHRPASHKIETAGKTAYRYVLSDWDMDSNQRYGWIVVNSKGITPYQINLND